MRARSVAVVAAVLSLLTATSVGAGSRAGAISVKLSAQCANVQVLSADIYLDGDLVGSVAPGSWTVTYVTVGRHLVEGASYHPDGQLSQKWGPLPVHVTADADGTTLLTCGWPLP